MSVSDSINRMSALILAKFPGAGIHRYQEPAAASPGDFTVLFKQETRKAVNRDHTLVDREYVIQGFGGDAEQAVQAMEALSKFLMNEYPAAPPEAGPSQFRIDTMTLTAPEKLDNGVFRCPGTIQIQSRETVAGPMFEKVRRVEVRTNNL
ncbi:hypothetical protein [Paenibacillus sp. PSB04]|uniref:hypothetical protein n=1 Tax=Paenibacillus sp. PSB04 TaxID=2866810 RepID=UPI0021F240A9|nr:hypothetical protein [Paenibacillus sp. PSB04]UYO03017.1 hypothetical protein K2F33_25320 [Paenibacillus sp. PSB04]